jgi:recombination protein RecA
MANAQKHRYKPIIIDTEGGITDNFCARWGLDPEKILYIYTPWIHEVKSAIAQIKSTEDEGFVIGVDSVGGLDRLKSYTDAAKGDPKADQGLLQKEIRSTLKLLLNVCIGQNSVGIACGHYYGMPATVPMPDQIGGGKAMKLFPSIIISLKKEFMKEGDLKSGDVIGNRITATTLKNRTYPPFQIATIEIDYKNGINKYAGILDLAVDSGIIKKGGSWYTYDGEKVQGEAKASEWLSEIKTLEDDIDKWLSDTGYSTISEEVREAEQLIIEEQNNDRNDTSRVPEEVYKSNRGDSNSGTGSKGLRKKPQKKKS